MRNWPKGFLAVVALCLFAANPILAATSGDIKAGHLELTEADPIEYTLTLNNKPVHKIEDYFVEIDRIFKNVDGKDVVLISSNAGGSGTGDSYALVIITPEGQVTATGSFGTGFRKPTINQQGKKISFLFREVKWVFENGDIHQEKATKKAGLSEKDCREIFDTYMKACVREKLCSGGKRDFPMAYEREVICYAGKINDSNFNSLCIQACGGKVVTHKKFKASVCSKEKEGAL